MAEKKHSVDYSLYLVTGRDFLPEGKVRDCWPRICTSMDILSVALSAILRRGELLYREYAHLHSQWLFAVD